MPGRAIPHRRMLRVTAIFSVTPVAVIVALSTTGYLSAGAAFIAAIIAVIGVAGVSWRYVSDVETISRYVEELTREGETPVPLILHSGSLTELASAIGQLGRSWQQHSEDMEHLAESTEAIIENLPQPLVLLDGQRRVVRATRAARDLLGGSVTGRDFAALLRDPMVLEAADRVIAGGRREEVEFSIRFPVERDFSAWIGPLPSTAMDGTVAVVALYDLTELKRADQMRVDFVANASHELRTPLSVLLGCVKTLRGQAKDDPEAQERFLTMMETQSERMTRLVEDLMSLSRIELNEHTVPSGSVDMEKIIGRIADSLVFPANARDMKIAVECEPGISPVAGDGEELTQVFQNLIDNALKYGGDSTTVTVTIRAADKDAPATMPENDGVVLVAVTDEGEGIAPEHQPRLTERFYRVDTGRSREMGGTGLGLAIVKHIVSRHRGQLRIDSDVGKGSTFNVYLPAAPSDAVKSDATDRKKAESAAAPAGSGGGDVPETASDSPATG